MGGAVRDHPGRASGDAVFYRVAGFASQRRARDKILRALARVADARIDRGTVNLVFGRAIRLAEKTTTDFTDYTDFIFICETCEICG